MQLPRNNWYIIGIAFGILLISWFFMMSFHSHSVIGNEGYYWWIAFKAALPLMAVLCMYAIAFRTAASRQRSKLVVHLTYLAMLAILSPIMWGGMEGSLSAHDAQTGVVVDFACVMALVFGAGIFWFFRVIEIAVMTMRRRNDVV